MTYSPGAFFQLTVDIICSPSSGLMHVQLAGEMAAARAALNLWYLEEAKARFTSSEWDELVEPILELDRACVALWTDYEASDGWRTGAGSDEVIAAQERMIAAVWAILPPKYYPHPPARAPLSELSNRGTGWEKATD